MSDHFLVVIPADPNQDLPGTLDDVRRLLGQIVGTDETRVENFGTIQFVDCGENFERIGCPHCSAEVSVENWQLWMGADWSGEDGFHLVGHQTSCCGRDVTLNDLVYEFPQGFARWKVSAKNTGRGRLTEAEVARLEGAAGCALTAIAQMY